MPVDTQIRALLGPGAGVPAATDARGSKASEQFGPLSESTGGCPRSAGSGHWRVHLQGLKIGDHGHGASLNDHSLQDTQLNILARTDRRGFCGGRPRPVTVI